MQEGWKKVVCGVLVADDETVSREAMAGLFRALGCAVQTAVDGAQACALASLTRFDLLLFDWRMPQCSGVEALRTIRADPASAAQHSIAVLMSGEDIGESAQLFREAGFARCFAKPIDVGVARQILALLPGAQPVLDEDAAERALAGNQAAIAQLRQMLATELRADLQRIPAQLGREENTAVRERLHQLTGAARYCGATALELAVDQLREVLKSASPQAVAWAQLARQMQAFIAAVAASESVARSG